MRKHIFALVDCNNFYVSCERVFQPQFNNLPAMVLSNNDGCVVARSNEVKELGIKMGAPAFKCRDLIDKYNIKVFSSNYSLYADMSQRVMRTLSGFSPFIEIYSIDEAFLEFTNHEIADWGEFGRQIKRTVEKWVGIPISVGIASTKVLTKIACEVVKKNEEFEGVLDLTRFGESEMDRYLECIDVNDIWGVGGQYSKKLRSAGIYTAKDLKYTDTEWIRRKMTVVGVRVVLELRGQACYSLDANPAAKKEICSSRSFGYPVTKKDDLEEAIASYTAIAAAKLRAQNSHANVIIVYIKTNRFKKGEKQYANAAYMKLDHPTNDTSVFTTYAQEGLKRIYRSGFRYKKAGVLLSGIQPSSEQQLSYFVHEDKKQLFRKRKFMRVIDKINREWGRGTIKLAAEGIKQGWQMKRSKVSQRYTTRWEELLKIKI